MGVKDISNVDFFDEKYDIFFMKNAFFKQI